MRIRNLSEIARFRFRKIIQFPRRVAVHIRHIRRGHGEVGGAGGVQNAAVGEQPVQVIQPSRAVDVHKGMIGSVQAVQIRPDEIAGMAQASKIIAEHAVNQYRIIRGLGEFSRAAAQTTGVGHPIAGGQHMVARKGEIIPFSPPEQPGALRPVVQGGSGGILDAVWQQGIRVQVRLLDLAVLREQDHQPPVILHEKGAIDLIAEIARHGAENAQGRIAF